MSPTLKRILLGLGALLVLGLLAYPKLPSFTGGEAEGNASTEARGSGGGDALRVDGHVVEPVLLEDRVQSTGTIQANEYVNLRTEVAGRVETVGFAEGERVRRGELLLKINDNELQAERRRTELRLSLATQQEQRQRELLAEGGISQETYDATLNEKNVLEAELQLLDAQIQKTELRAPFDGVLGLRDISPGSFVSSETTVTTLQELNPVRVEFTLPERYARRVTVGDEIQFTVEGVDDEFTAEIYALDPVIQQGTRSLRLRARAENPDRQLWPGNFANVSYVIERFEDALVVPSIAVIPSLEGRRVYVLQDGEAQPRSVETGLRTERNLQIVRGLAPQDTVITTGLQRLRPGLPVRLSETTEGQLPEVAPGEGAMPDTETTSEETEQPGTDDDATVQ